MSRHLAIEISYRSVHLQEMQNEQFIRDWQTELSGRTSEELKKELDAFFTSERIQFDQFNALTVGTASKQSTLIPSTVFGESNAKDIFRLCFSQLNDNQELDYNRIPEHGVVNVFSHPDWIKSYFVVRFPLVVIQHSGSHLIRSVMSSNTFKTKIGLHVYRDFFLMTIVKHDKLEFYSFFDHTAAEDLIYHLMFVLQQKELSGDNGSIVITPGAGSDKALIDSAVVLFNKVNELKNYNIEVSKGLHAKSQLLCV